MVECNPDHAGAGEMFILVLGGDAHRGEFAKTSVGTLCSDRPKIIARFCPKISDFMQ